MKEYVVAITGASGSILGVRVVEEILKTSEVHLIISSQTFSIMKHETGIDLSGDIKRKIKGYFKSKRLFFYDEGDFYAPVSSGSFKTDGMLVVPCSMKTLSGIANGYTNSLIERAADVTLKEGRVLLVSPREIPFSAIHLENMLKLARLGVKVIPPVTAFYHKPKDIDGLVDFIVGKILDSIGVENNLFERWGTKDSNE